MGHQAHSLWRKQGKKGQGCVPVNIKDARGWPLQPPQPLSLGEALRLVMQLRGRAPLGRRERGSTGSLTQERCDYS